MFSDIASWLGLSGPDNENTKKALMLQAYAAQQGDRDIASVDTKTDDTATLSKKAREVAGQQAADKAAEAKKSAKAASAMQGGSKLLNAINAASAAQEASTSGFDTASNNAMSMEAQRQQADVSNRLAKAQARASARNQMYQSAAATMANRDAMKEQARQNRLDRANRAGAALIGAIPKVIEAGLGTGTGSDAGTKNFIARKMIGDFKNGKE